MLEGSSGVYKLIGPILMKVDINEAKQNVSKRLQFIEGEVSKVENSIGEKFIWNLFIQYL